MENFRTLIKLSRPLFLLFTLLTYSLGAGIAHYLGRPINVLVFIFGLLIVIALQLSSFFLLEYFRLSLVPLKASETFQRREQFRVLLLQVSAAILVLAVALLIVLLQERQLTPQMGVLLGIIFLLLFAYALPPLQLSESGYGELLMAFYLATLLPILAYLIQTDSYHRLLPMTTFPLTLLALAYLLIMDFPDYAGDQKNGRKTLLTRLTWQRAIPIHHLLILGAFLIFALEPALGLPWSLIWPTFMVIPFAGFQIVWLQRIANGGPTFWHFLTNLAAAVFGLAAYLLAFTLWIR